MGPPGPPQVMAPPCPGQCGLRVPHTQGPQQFYTPVSQTDFGAGRQGPPGSWAAQVGRDPTTPCRSQSHTDHSLLIRRVHGDSAHSGSGTKPALSRSIESGD